MMGFLRLRRYRKDEEGAATVEFVLVFSFLLVIVLSIFEVGWLMTRQMMLDRGVDVAVRNVRLGTGKATTHDGLKDEICKYSKILTNCTRDLVLELVIMDVAADYPQNQPNCKDREPDALDPVISYTPGGREEIMFVRACMIIDPIFPGAGLGLQL